MKNNILYYLTILLCVYPFQKHFAATGWNNFILNFDKGTYGRGSQTWQIAPYDSKWIYIAAFNNSGWNIVDFGKRHGRKGHFQEMGRRMAYMTFGLSDGRLVPASDPFIIENDGTIRFMKADTSSVRQVCLTRKMLLTEHVARMESRLKGGKIQASDYVDFRTAETLYVIDSTIFPDLVPLKASRKYRYWRMLSAEGSYGSISELQFFLTGETEKAQGRIIGTPGYGPAWGIDNVFDGS